MEEITNTSYYYWSNEKTMDLIKKRIQFDKIFIGRQGSTAGWNAIGKALAENSKLCQKKWNNLSQKYKKLKTPSTGTSTEDGEVETPITWPFYNEMDKFYSSRHTINPVGLFDSSAVNNVANKKKLSALYANAKKKIVSQCYDTFNSPPSIPPVVPNETPSSKIIEDLDLENSDVVDLSENESKVKSKMYTNRRGPYNKRETKSLDDDIRDYLKKENDRGDRMLKLLQQLVNK